MNLDGQRTTRVLVISLLVLILSTSCHSWHRTLTFIEQLSYELSPIKKISLCVCLDISLLLLASDQSNQLIITDMKFFMWFNSYAIYGAREMLILLRPDPNNSTVDFIVNTKDFLTKNI